MGVPINMRPPHAGLIQIEHGAAPPVAKEDFEEARQQDDQALAVLRRGDDVVDVLFARHHVLLFDVDVFARLSNGVANGRLDGQVSLGSPRKSRSARGRRGPEGSLRHLHDVAAGGRQVVGRGLKESGIGNVRRHA